MFKMFNEKNKELEKYFYFVLYIINNLKFLFERLEFLCLRHV